jgi:hypothetical protein
VAGQFHFFSTADLKKPAFGWKSQFRAADLSTLRLKPQPEYTVLLLMGRPREDETMPKFYFRHYVNGQWITENWRGAFTSPSEACTYAVRRAPDLLRKVLRLNMNTYLSTEVSDGERTRFIIRGKITSERA